MKAYRALPVLAVLMLLSGCKELVVPDFNDPNIGELTGPDATRTAVINAVQGLFINARFGIAGRAGYVSELGILGRESFNFDVADPRFVTELLRDPLDGGNGAFGGNHWTNRYNGLRDAKIVLDAAAGLDNMTDAEKAGIRGIASTLTALDLLLVINTRDNLGAVVSVTEDPTGDLAPIVDKATVFSTIESLLDGAVTDLGSAGGSFASDLRFPSGFSGFDTPAGFTEFNRALRARVDVYQGNHASALTNLAASFLDGAASFSLGVYYSYGTGSGDIVNSLFDPGRLNILAHPSILTDAQTQTDGVTLDRRALDKTESVTRVDDQGGLGLSTDLGFTVYASADAGVAIVRNEELILLRAEANIQLGGAANLTAANTDINLIRAAAGLAAIDLTTMTATQRIDALLYERRYSLMHEGGHRWLDMRRYGRLADLAADDLVAGPPSTALVIHEFFPFPESECSARDPAPTGC